MQKITCPKCHKDITGSICKRLNNFQVGNVTCPHCNNNMHRYFSESDVLLYLGCSEVMYLIFSLITCLVYYYVGINIVLIPIILCFFVVVYFLNIAVCKYIFVKAPGKLNYKSKIFDEDASSIAKSNNWQFVLFFALAITAITGTSFQLFFLVIAFGAVILTFVKYYLCIKRERSEL